MAADVPARQGGKWPLVTDGTLREFIGVRDYVTVWIEERFDVEGGESTGSRHPRVPSSHPLRTQAHRDTCVVHFCELK